MRSRKIGGVLAAILLLVVAFGAGAFFGYEKRPYMERVLSVAGKEPQEVDPKVNFEPFWKAWSLLEQKYVAEDAIDQQKMLWGAIEGLASALGDPYTSFFPPQQNEVFEGDIRGSFEGIGAEIGIRNGSLVVIAPLEGSPAQKAGLRPGDFIVKIDNFETVSASVEEAVSHIRGERGTTVKLTVFRESETETKEISIIRDTIVIPTLSSEKKDDVFVIKLHNFSLNAPRAFENAIREFTDSGSHKLILDLRNNPGGYLNAAIDIASWFVKEGDVVVIEEMRDQDPIEYRSRGHAEMKNITLVVLVNRGSASASEILAGALKDHRIGTIMGEKTFGKGSVQEVVSVTDNTSLKITIARWLTPRGHSISNVGLEPDIGITEQELQEAEKGGVVDLYMDKAIEYLNKQ